MPVKIQSTKDVHVNGIKMVVFGYAGSGKTRLMSTAPNPIIISAERGLLSLADFDLPYFNVETPGDINEVFQYLKTHDDYDTICLDSLSEISETVLSKFKKEKNAEGETNKDARNAYGKLADAMLPMIRHFRDLEGKNVVFTAKAKRIEDQYTGRTQVEPMMPGQLVPLNLPYMVDELLYLDVAKKGERILQCQPSFGVLAKDRSGKLNATEPADLKLIFAKIAGNRVKDTPGAMQGG